MKYLLDKINSNKYFNLYTGIGGGVFIVLEYLTKHGTLKPLTFILLLGLCATLLYKGVKSAN